MARRAPFRERTARRLAILRGRTLRTVQRSRPRHFSVFMHMPKCGGTSLSEAMYATVPFDHRVGVIDAVSTRRASAMMTYADDDALITHEDFENGQSTFDFREGLLLQHMAWDTMLIHGHLFWSERADRMFGERYKYVTLLRDPVARAISNMRMCQREGIVSSSIDTYLESPVARRHTRVYLRYLSGRNDIPEEDVPKALDLASERLSRFDLVGFLDDLPGFSRNYHALFGVRLRLSKLNVAPEKTTTLTDAQIERIHALCAPDITLYEQALGLWSRDCNGPVCRDAVA